MSKPIPKHRARTKSKAAKGETPPGAPFNTRARIGQRMQPGPGVTVVNPPEVLGDHRTNKEKETMTTERVQLDPDRGVKVPQSSAIDHDVEGPVQSTALDLGAARGQGNRLDLGPARERAEAEARAQAAHNAPLPRSDDGGDSA